MVPSKYQSEVYNWITNGSGNAVVEAVAGSGKSSTIIQCLKYIPTDSKALFLAFNKAIADTLKDRVPSNVQACTLNSYGFSILNKAQKGYKKVDADKAMTQLRFNILNVKKGDKDSESWFYTIRHAVKRVVSLLKANYIISPTHADIIKVMEAYDIQLNKVKADKLPMFYDNCIATFQLGIKTFNLIDFDDQIFMPVYHNYDCGTYDFIFVDEAQDLNPVQIEFIKRIK